MDYPAIRALLLSEASSAEEEVEWLVEAGSYLRTCWLQEEEFLQGQPLDENATRDLWDGFTTEQIKDLRGRGRVALKLYTRRRAWRVLFEHIGAAFARAGWTSVAHGLLAVARGIVTAAKGVVYVIKEMSSGVLHAAGVIFFAWTLSHLLPGFWEEARSTLQEVFGLK